MTTDKKIEPLRLGPYKGKKASLRWYCGRWRWNVTRPNGKRTNLTLKETSRKGAEKEWKAIVTRMLAGDFAWPSGRRGRAPSVPGRSVDALCEQYRRNPATTSMKTSTHNTSSLLWLAKLFGLSPGEHGVETMTLVLAEKAVYGLQRKEDPGLGSVSYNTALDCNTSINARFRAAKSMFSDHHMRCYRDAVLELEKPGFCEMRRLKEPSHEFVPFPADTERAINEAGAALKETRPHMWLVHHAVKSMALRASEVIAMRNHWVEPAGTKGMFKLVIKNRPGEFQTKAKDASVMVPRYLLPYFLGTGRAPVIPLDDRAREHLVRRTHSQWLRQFIPDRVKSNHELRKYSISLVIMKTGSLYKGAKFGRITMATAEKHYAALIKELPAHEEDVFMVDHA